MPVMLASASSRPIRVGSLDLVLKRLADTLIAGIALLLLCPLILVVSLCVRLSSDGPLLYRQKRVGKDGRLFEIYKFRTMYIDAEQSGPSVTSADDSRITPLGRWLRAKKLDEIPQLLNVLKGDMSLVGPRPQVPRFVEHFDPTLRPVVLAVRPGITGPTALRFRREEDLLTNKTDRETYYIQEILPVKLCMDAEYVRTRTFWGDIRLLGQTALLLVSAYARVNADRMLQLADGTAVL